MAVLQPRALARWCLIHSSSLMQKLAKQEVMSEAI